MGGPSESCGSTPVAIVLRALGESTRQSRGQLAATGAQRNALGGKRTRGFFVREPCSLLRRRCSCWRAGQFPSTAASVVDKLECLGKPVTIRVQRGEPPSGTRGPDVIWGTSGLDVIHAGDGVDRVCGNGGWDRIYGGRGANRSSNTIGDHLSGGPGRTCCMAARARTASERAPAGTNSTAAATLMTSSCSVAATLFTAGRARTRSATPGQTAVSSWTSNYWLIRSHNAVSCQPAMSKAQLVKMACAARKSATVVAKCLSAEPS
jgi:hypothetical protein